MHPSPDVYPRPRLCGRQRLVVPLPGCLAGCKGMPPEYPNEISPGSHSARVPRAPFCMRVVRLPDTGRMRSALCALPSTRVLTSLVRPPPHQMSVIPIRATGLLLVALGGVLASQQALAEGEITKGNGFQPTPSTLPCLDAKVAFAMCQQTDKIIGPDVMGGIEDLKNATPVFVKCAEPPPLSPRLSSAALFLSLRDRLGSFSPFTLPYSPSVPSFDSLLPPSPLLPVSPLLPT